MDEQRRIFRVSLNFDLEIFGACMGIALLFVGLYYFYPQHREGVRFIGWAMTVGIAIYTAFHAAKTFDYNIAR